MKSEHNNELGELENDFNGSRRSSANYDRTNSLNFGGGDLQKFRGSLVQQEDNF